MKTITQKEKKLYEMCYMGCALTHCICADFDFDTDVSETFDRSFHIKERLLSTFGKDWHKSFHNKGGTCIASGPFSFDIFGIRKVMVFSLVTKERRNDTPALEDMKEAFFILRKQCEKYGIRKIAVPKTGCGFDELRWDDICTLIDMIFKGSGIHIVICNP
jgi:hypothetical protein